MKKSLFLSILFLASVLFLTGCSMFSGGGGSGISDEELALQQSDRWGDGSIPNAQADGLFKDVHFEYDSSVVSRADYELLEQNAKVLKSDPTLHAEIEGHCDKRGTNEYNLALGENRAKSVAKILTSFGVASSQLSTISYGEEIPLDPADTEDAYAKNRRAHFALYRNKN